MYTVIGAFDDQGAAERALERLVESGFDRADVHLQPSDPASAPDGAADEPEGGEREVAVDRRGFFASLFGMGDHEPHAHIYTEAVRRGSSVVVVDAPDEAQADRAAALLHELGALDVDERATQWRAAGWGGGDGGERRPGRGGVRVVERVSQQPVREIVRRFATEPVSTERVAVGRVVRERPAVRQEGDTLVVPVVEERAVVHTELVLVEEIRITKERGERDEP